MTASPPVPVPARSRLTPLQIVVTFPGLIIGMVWPFGPLVVAALLYFTVLRDSPSRRAVIWVGLALSVAELVVLAALFMSGAAGHLFFERH